MLSGKTIVITGAGRGLGAHFAKACGLANAKTIIVADIDEALGEATAKTLRDSNVDASFIPVDLGDAQSIDAFASALSERYQHIDGLVNNGAIATGIGGKLFNEIDIETWDRVMRVNVRGTWLMVKACHAMLKNANGARVVNLASDTALWGAPRLLHYVASKGAIISMTRSLARELGADEITVNAVAPGLVIGESTDYVPEERKQHYVDGRALSREQTPDDVSGTIVYLLSDAAAFVTGQLLPVNGGFVFN